MTSQELVTHLGYSAWASGKLLDAAAQLEAGPLTEGRGTSHQSILGALTHIFLADRIWFARLQGAVPAALANPGEEHTLDSLRSEWTALLVQFASWVAALNEADLDRQLDYKTLDGTPQRTGIGRILLHVVNHGTYHRGQVAAMMRQAGVKPPSTDLIFYYRELSQGA